MNSWQDDAEEEALGEGGAESDAPDTGSFHLQLY